MGSEVEEEIQLRMQQHQGAEKTDVNIEVFDRTKVREATETAYDLDEARGRHPTPKEDSPAEVLKVYHGNPFYQKFSDRYEKRVERLVQKLEQKETIAFSKNIINYTNHHNVFRPSGAAYAAARKAVLAQPLPTRN